MTDSIKYFRDYLRLRGITRSENRYRPILYKNDITQSSRLEKIINNKNKIITQNKIEVFLTYPCNSIKKNTNKVNHCSYYEDFYEMYGLEEILKIREKKLTKGVK